jgi:hypothetical protein
MTQFSLLGRRLKLFHNSVGYEFCDDDEVWIDIPKGISDNVSDDSFREWVSTIDWNKEIALMQLKEILEEYPNILKEL